MRTPHCRTFALALLLVVVCAGMTGCDETPYTVVGRLDVATAAGERSIGCWQITCDATTQGEWAQTARQAALDLHEKHGTDYTGVLLTPSKDIREIVYAQVGYAADGKGTLGLDGADVVGYEWDVRVVDRSLTDEELAIVELWEQKMPDFPSTDPLSSYSYDVDALRQYIAETLDIDLAQAQRPLLIPKEYKGVY